MLWNCLAYFNSCVNPIIYNRTSKEFRDAFLEACGCLRDRARSNSTELAAAAEGRRLSAVDRVTPDRRHPHVIPNQTLTIILTLNPNP